MEKQRLSMALAGERVHETEHTLSMMFALGISNKAGKEVIGY